MKKKVVTKVMAFSLAAVMASNRLLYRLQNENKNKEKAGKY